jgi:hypothetical protein
MAQRTTRGGHFSGCWATAEGATSVKQSRITLFARRSAELIKYWTSDAQFWVWSLLPWRWRGSPTEELNSTQTNGHHRTPIRGNGTPIQTPAFAPHTRPHWVRKMRSHPAYAMNISPKIEFGMKPAAIAINRSSQRYRQHSAWHVANSTGLCYLVWALCIKLVMVSHWWWVIKDLP